MLIGLLVKMLATVLVVVAVALAVAYLGPRLGGIFAGMPMVLGPGYFFMLREQPPEFIAAAAVFTLHGISATMLFTVCYVVTAARLGAVSSLGLAALCWLPAAWLFVSLPGALLLALGLYVLVFLAARWVDRRLGLPQPRVSSPARWGDLLLRGVLAGLLVGMATTVAAAFGPLLSGLLVGFPIGLLTIGLTLHQRYGAGVSRATLAAAQPAMFSLAAFTVAVGLSAGRLPPMLSFSVALAASCTVSAGLLVMSRRTAISPDRGHGQGGRSDCRGGSLND